MKRIFLIISIFLSTALVAATPNEAAASNALQRILNTSAQRFRLIETQFPTAQNDAYEVTCDGQTVTVKGNSAVALLRGAYDYLRNAADSIVTWSGQAVRLPQKGEWPRYSRFVQSPYQYRYFYNVVTAGYTTAFWDWQRWEKEIDWLALHGVNMPLMGGAHEAILYRVWRKLGLTEKEALDYFTGPAHFPWNRMGNITRWDGPPSLAYFEKQIALTHKQLQRMRSLGMEPIIHAFAGFVPAAITRLYPDVKLLDLTWGGFDKSCQAQILTPDNPLFSQIGTLYIQEWEKEFGKNRYYLADSFNEMDVPVSGDINQQCQQLADFGYRPYKAIIDANPDAVWVMQGWTFPFHKQNGKLFWTPQRLQALLSKVPDDKLLILDMANEYNALFWKIDPSWKLYEGFFGKQWIYSFIPNMGGKVDFTGVLDFYANAPIEALHYEKRGHCVGFGTAPEAIENNEVVYELIMDMGWQEEAIDTSQWLKNYYRCRYGKLTAPLEEAIDLLHRSTYSSFTDHPRRSWQFKAKQRKQASAFRSPEFLKSIELFLSCHKDFENEPLYVADMLELSAFYLGCYAEDLYEKVNRASRRKKEPILNELLAVLEKIDILLQHHPTLKMETWIADARRWGETEAEKNAYESNAKRLITTWGGWVDEYSARLWSGLIRDYYLKRIEFEQTQRPSAEEMAQWQERWVQTPGYSPLTPLKDPLEKAVQWCQNLEIKQDSRLPKIDYRPFG